MSDQTFLRAFLVYLQTHKRLWLAPLIVALVVLLLLTLLFMGGGVLSSMYRDF